MKNLLTIILVGILLIGCTVTRVDESKVTLDKKELDQVLYEWSMYRELTIILYAQKHKVTREASEKYLKAQIDDNKDVAAQWLRDVAMLEYQRKYDLEHQEKTK